MYLKIGGYHLDLAKSYGTEQEVGEAIRASGVPRSKLFIAAKIEGPIGHDKAIQQVLEYDLPVTGLDYFDLLLMHYPCQTFGSKCGPHGNEERLDTWRGMEYLKGIGKVRALGVSNFDMGQLQQLYHAGHRPAVNQVQWHLGFHDDGLLRGAKAGGTYIEAWASLASPVLGGYGMVKPGSSIGDPRLTRLARKHNVSAVQIALQWMNKRGITPLTGTCVITHAQDDLASFSGFNLSSDDIEYLNDLSVSRNAALAAGGIPSTFQIIQLSVLALFASVVFVAVFAASKTEGCKEHHVYISLA